MFIYTYFVETLEVLAEENGKLQIVLSFGVQVTVEQETRDEEKARLEELTLIEANSGYVCMGHIFGYSKKRVDEKRPEEQLYCPGCVHDRNNRLCPHYKPFKLLYIEPILKQEPSSSF